MSTLLYYSLAWPIILIGSLVEFIVWELFSNGRWKQRRMQSNPAKHWQDEALGATRKLRELEYKSRRLEENQKERKK